MNIFFPSLELEFPKREATAEGGARNAVLLFEVSLKFNFFPLFISGWKKNYGGSQKQILNTKIVTVFSGK